MEHIQLFTERYNGDDNRWETVHRRDWEAKLSELNTLDLENDQVRFPRVRGGQKYSFVFDGRGFDENYYLYIIGQSKIPTSGPFEIIIENMEDQEIGFIRGTVHNQIISFNMIYLKPEWRGRMIGTDIYQTFLDKGYIFKSDSEITDTTYSLYHAFVFREKREPIWFPEDDTVGFK